MTLDAAARRRYARQLLLGEIDEVGQLRLQRSFFRRGVDVDAAAYEVAADYLARAGCIEGEQGDELKVADEASVRRFAGRVALYEPAAAVIGAFAAVEHMKEALGFGEARAFPSEVTLGEE